MFRKLHVGFSFRLFFSTSVDVEKKKMDFFFHIKFRLMWKIGVEKILMWKIRHYLDLKKKYAHHTASPNSSSVLSKLVDNRVVFPK